MKRKKPVAIIIAILVVMQLFQFHTNHQQEVSPNDITLKYPVPGDVYNILKRSCYDCHSNTTIYPWYSYIQPVGWWLNHHINEGKQHLNFSEFSAYTTKRANHKLEKIAKAVTEGWMPLDSYLWIHHDAKLSKEEAARIAEWSNNLRDSVNSVPVTASR